MTPLDFPSSPSTGQVYSANSKSYLWNGRSWINYAAASASAAYDPIPLDVHGQTDAANCVFLLRRNQVPLSDTDVEDSRDIEVIIDGEQYSPYVSQKAFAYMPIYEVDSRTFRVRENRLIIYNAPDVGANIKVVVKKTSTTPQTRRYPFSATTIGLGD